MVTWGNLSCFEHSCAISFCPICDIW